MTIRTRFAPSPTGMLHIGGARTALFNYLFAKNQGGKFLLRIEDTDKKRSTNEAKQAITDGLKWLGLEYDEIIYQSENEKRHQEIAYKLLESGKAYYCYTPAEELVELRKEAEKKGEVFRFQSPWRDKQPSQKMDVKPVIRIKAPRDGQAIISDIVQGEVVIANSELDDLVILRNDGTPTYMLAVVVDDHDMNISHILRGDDHLTNSFRQKVIYDALGWQVPKFIHIPLIYGPDGSKMSKRHGATSVTQYDEMGYLPEAMRNYLLRLGWSHGDDEIISDDDAIKWFNLDHIGKSPARFDFAKLEHLNKHYIKQSTNEALLKLIKPRMAQDLNIQLCQDKVIKALDFLKERAANLNELAKSAEIYIDGYDHQYALTHSNNDRTKFDTFLGEGARLYDEKLIHDLRNSIANIGDWSLETIKEATNNYAAAHGLKMKDFGKPLRFILTFSTSSAGGIFEIIHILEQEEVLSRFDRYINYFGEKEKFVMRATG